MKRILLFALALSTAIGTWAQVKTSAEVIIPITPESPGAMDIETFGKNGLMAITLNNKDVKGSYTTVVDFYDVELDKGKTLKSSLPYVYASKGDYKNESHFYRINAKAAEYVLRDFEMNGDVEETRFDLNNKFHLIDFVVENDKAYMGGMIKSNVNFYILDVKSKKVKTINFLKYFKGLTFFKSMQYLKESKELHLWVYTLLKGKPVYHLLIIDEDGEVKDNAIEFKPMADKYMDEVSAKKLANGDYIITGTYGSKNYDTVKKAKYSAIMGYTYIAGGATSFGSSNGFFICKLSDGSFSNIQFTLYTKLDKFFDYLSEKGQSKIDKKKEKAEAKGKEFETNQLMILHEVKETKTGFLVIGEAYYPTYRTETYSSGGKTYTRRVFDGFQYTHAVILDINKDLEIEGNNIFEMTLQYKPYSARRFINVGFDKGETQLVYSTGNKIYTRTFTGSEQVSETEDVIKIDEDALKSSTSSSIEYWYPGTFVSYGEQYYKVKNEKDKKEKKREHFIMKLDFK